MASQVAMARRPPTPPPENPTTGIRRERLMRQWTQAELARRVSEVLAETVTPITISRWENDKRNLTVVELAAVAVAFGMQTRDLLPGDDGLSDDERHLLDVWRTARAHERKAMLGLTNALHDARSVEFETRPQSRR
jgi:transcriptional regulator with XRE-family HTH domain